MNRIWLITIGEPIPLNNFCQDRLFRTGNFANYLARHDHEVIWWTSTFDHFRKVHLFTSDTDVKINDCLTIKLLHGCGYQSNLSFKRIIDHWYIAKKFQKKTTKCNLPDVILAAFPTIELSIAATQYGKNKRVPVVLDMRDMWPDIFIDLVPKPFRKISTIIALPLFKRAKRACSQATAITGITESFVEWGVNKAGRSLSHMDRAFPLGYISYTPNCEDIQEAEKYWDEKGVTADKFEFVACFFGTFGRQLDLKTVIASAHKLNQIHKSNLFVLCGTGDRIEYYKNISSQLPNVFFAGQINAAQIFTLMRRASVGLDPLPDRYDFLATINNKAIEYMPPA